VVTGPHQPPKALWNNGLLRPFLVLITLFSLSLPLAAQDNLPRLLLTARRLHRLKLDRQRQTERWVHFEDRVRTVPDSPERGFELALYATVTGDDALCREAIQWGLAHPAEHRQNALIVNWCETALSAGQRQSLLAPSLAANDTKPFTSARDRLFVEIAQGQASRSSIRAQWSHLLPMIQRDPRVCLPEFYALFEFLDAADRTFRLDLRQDDGHLFTELPSVFLLSLGPGKLQQPDWQTRIAGLMMVSLDPNLQGASFIQGWAMEDPKMVREGPGVAYEFLWADPYLPGLGFYNMEPWVYDRPSGLLLARSSWDANACRISLYHGNLKSFQCPANPPAASQEFGKLTLVPLERQCVTVPPQKGRTYILSNLQPKATVQWQNDRSKLNGTADASGLFRVSAETVGKVCRANAK
jgi:hypothetical protein